LHGKYKEVIQHKKNFSQLTDRKDTSEDRGRVAERATVPATHAKLVLTFIDGHLCSET
jgi:hypothetical protein